MLLNSLESACGEDALLAGRHRWLVRAVEAYVQAPRGDAAEAERLWADVEQALKAFRLVLESSGTEVRTAPPAAAPVMMTLVV